MKKIIISVFFLLLSQISFSQCNSWENFPGGKGEALEEHVIYRDKLKQKKIEEAYPIWENLFKTVQISTPNKKTHFLDGIEMSLYFAKKDEANKSKWLEKADSICTNYYSCIGSDPNQKAWQAYYHFQNNWKLDEAFQLMQDVISCRSDSVPAMTISHTARLGIFLYKRGKCDSSRLLTIYKRLEKISDDKILGSDSINTKKYWNDAKSQFSIVEEIFDCDWWKNKIINDSLDLDKLTYYKFNIFVKCGSEDSIYKDLKNKIWEIKKNLVIEEELLVVSKDTTTIWRKILAYRNLQEWDTLYKEKYYKEENELYQKLDLSEREWVSDETRANELYRFAYKLYQAGKLVSARDFCRSASRWCPNWGDPYILTGILYVENINVNNFDSRMNIWVAIDEWNKAIRLDKTVTEKANNYIKNWSKYLPTKTELFQRGIAEGSLMTIGNWIQQNTRAWGI
jgi:hypothetical protein